MPRPDRRTERIPQIIQAAMMVFARNGFAQTRMEDIAYEAGLSKAAIYLYFASKDEVIITILQTFFEHGFVELSLLLASENPVSNSLLVWTRQCMQKIQENTTFLSIGFEFHAAAARQKTTQQVLQRYYDRYRTSLAALIEKGIDRDEFQAVDAQEMAIAVMSIYEGLTILWMLNTSAFDLVGVAERTVQALVDRIVKVT